MICTLTVIRYPRWMGWAGIASMAVFRVPLWKSHNRFWKLMGCGKNGTFDTRPDWRQWAVLEVNDSNEMPGAKSNTPSFLTDWWQLFGCEKWLIELEPIEGHGTWDGQQCFGELPRQSTFEGLTAVLTRATIRPARVKSFWKNVNRVAERMTAADGFITSLGIGEMPLFKQATFSIWESKAKMKAFAYNSHEHTDVIRKTRQENWYSEEMFVRFRVLSAVGTINGKNPMERKS